MLSLIGKGQITDFPFFPKIIDKSNSFTIYADQIANSNSITNQFLSTINQSGYINDDIKTHQIDRLKDINYFGQIRHIGFDGIIKNTKSSALNFYTFGIHHQYFSEALINEDILKLALLGNKDFMGETVNVPELKYSSLYFNQLSFGMLHIFIDSDKTHQLSWKANLNFGQNFNQTEINNSSLHTNLDGSQLDIVMDMRMHRSDTSWNKIYNIAGIGLSGDVSYSLTIDDKYYLKARIGNLGMISWTSSIENIIDTSFSFNGLELDTTSTGQSINNPLLNLSFNENNEYVKFNELESFMMFIPIEFEISTGMFYANQKLYSGIRFFYYPSMISKPLIEFLTTYNLNNQFRITPVVSIGGYGGINAGLRLGWNINEQWSIYAGSSYLSSMLNSKNGKGSGGLFQLAYRL